MPNSSPNLLEGQQPTAIQWNGFFTVKQDYNAILDGVISQGGALSPNGGAVGGPLTLAAPATQAAQVPQLGQVLSTNGGTVSAVVSVVQPTYQSGSGDHGQVGGYFGFNRGYGTWVYDNSMGGSDTGIQVVRFSRAYIDGSAADSWWHDWIDYNAASASNANGERSDVVQYTSVKRQLSPASLALGRNAVPGGLTTVAATLSAPGTAVVVGAVDYFGWTYPANEGAVAVSSANPGAVIIGSGTYEVVEAISTAGSIDAIMGPHGPGTLICSGAISVSDGTASNQVIGLVAGEPIEVRNIPIYDMSGYSSNRSGGISIDEIVMQGAGPDDVGSGNAVGVQSTLYGQPYLTYGARYHHAYYPAFNPGNLGTNCAYTEFEIGAHELVRIITTTPLKYGHVFFGGGTFYFSLFDSRGMQRGPNGYTFRCASGTGDGVAWGGGTAYESGVFGGGNEAVTLTVGASGQRSDCLRINYRTGNNSGYLTPGMKTAGGDLGLNGNTALTEGYAGPLLIIQTAGTMTLPAVSSTFGGEGFLFLNQTNAVSVVACHSGADNITVFPGIGEPYAALNLLPGDYVHMDSDGGNTWRPIIRSNLAGPGGPQMTVAQLGSLVASLGAADNGRPAWAEDGRANASQTSGNGKGCGVKFNQADTAWVADWSGVAVTN